MITCGQSPSVPWYSPEGFKTVRSAPHSAPNLSWNLMPVMRETLSCGGYLALQLNDITFSAFFSLSLQSASLSAFSMFLLSSLFLLRWWGPAWLTVCSCVLLSCINLCIVAHRNCFIFYFLRFPQPLIHLFSTTWTGWHHLRLLHSYNGRGHLVAFR